MMRLVLQALLDGPEKRVHMRLVLCQGPVLCAGSCRERGGGGAKEREGERRPTHQEHFSKGVRNKQMNAGQLLGIPRKLRTTAGQGLEA